LEYKENKDKEINERELKALVSLLDDEDYDIVYQIEQKIISLGNEMIPFLEHEWENSFNPQVQKKIEELIHQLQFDQLKSRLLDWKNRQGEDLLEGMWLVATYQYPDLDLSQLRKDLEQLFYDAWLEYKPNLHPYDQIKVLNGVMFSKLKFSSNTKNFHAPSNSMINIVMETKKGNPISLCVVYMLIAQKLNMPVYGVNLPNLFILTYKTPQMQFYINAFNKGLIFSRADIDNYIAQLHVNPLEIFYEPCSHLDIVKRVLRNLIISYEKLDEHQKADEVKQLLLTISDEDTTLE
jgi:regulator of sirC expression with transglutaminase-like and TPR domain